MHKIILLLTALTVTVFVCGCHNGELGFAPSKYTPITPRIETPSRAESIRRANQRLRRAGVRNPSRYTKHHLNWAR